MPAVEIVIPLNEVEPDDDDREPYYMAYEIEIPFPVDLKNYVLFVFLKDGKPRVVLQPRRI